jgi:RNA polymerase sigma-70 factor (ECF subfamily)
MLVEFETVERARDGDAAAFTILVNTYRRRILGTISRLIGRPDDVEDVAQEVFLRLYDSLSQLRHPQIFEPWLYRLTMNASLDYLRKRKRRPEFRMSDLSEQQVMAADARVGTACERDQKEKSRVREFMGELLGRVSEEDRVLLTLKEVEGLSLKELESVYDVNENALKVRLFRARQRVLKAFAALGEIDPRGKEAV